MAPFTTASPLFQEATKQTHIITLTLPCLTLSVVFIKKKLLLSSQRNGTHLSKNWAFVSSIKIFSLVIEMFSEKKKYRWALLFLIVQLNCEAAVLWMLVVLLRPQKHCCSLEVIFVWPAWEGSLHSFIFFTDSCWWLWVWFSGFPELYNGFISFSLMTDWPCFSFVCECVWSAAWCLSLKDLLVYFTDLREHV